MREIKFRLYLTERRLILSAQRPYEKDSSDIPLPVIHSVRTGENDIGEPTLLLGIKAPNGSNRRIIFSFCSGSGWNRTSERNHLKDMLEICASQSRRPPVKADVPQRSPAPATAQQKPKYINRRVSAPPPANDAEFITGPPQAPVYAENAAIRNPGKESAGGQKRHRPALNFDFLCNEAPDTNTIPGTIAGFILSPVECFKATDRKAPVETLPVLLVCMAVFAFGSTIFLGIIASAAGASEFPALAGLADPGTAILVSIGFLILCLAMVFVNGFLLNVGSSCAGVRTDVIDTFRVASYSAVPFLAGGLIPVFGMIIAPFWSLYLQFTGMKENFSMENEKAAIAVLIPAAVFLAAIGIFAATGGA